jgi:solute:Na+ symporter, SSS family
MAFAPLAFGLYWKRATNQGAIFSIVLGGAVWLSLLLPMIGWIPAPEPWITFANTIPPQFIGLLAGIIAMICGSLAPQWITHAPQAARH